MEEEKMDIAEKLIAKARELDAIILAGYEKIAESDAFTQRIESAVEDQVGDIEDQIKSAVEDALYSWDIAESDGVKDTLHDLVESEIDSQFRSDKFKSVLETAVSKEVAQRMMISSRAIAEKLDRFADSHREALGYSGRIQNLENGDVERFHALEDQIKKLELQLAEQQRPMTPIDQSFGRVEKRIAQLDINQQRHEKALADSRLNVMDKLDGLENFMAKQLNVMDKSIDNTNRLDELENFIAKQFKQTEVMAKLEEIMGQFRLADIGPLGSIPDSTDWSDTYRGMDKSID